MDKETDRQRHRDREKKKRGGTEGDNNNKNTANLPSTIPSHHIHSKYLDDKSKLLISQSPQAAQQRRKIPSPCCFSFPPNFFLSFFLVFFFPVLPREDNTYLFNAGWSEMTYAEHRRDLCPQDSSQVSLTKGQPSSGQGYTWADKSMRLKGHTCEPTYIIRPQQSHGVKTDKKLLLFLKTKKEI